MCRRAGKLSADGNENKGFRLLEKSTILFLVTDVFSEDHVFFLALTCTAFRDALQERFPLSESTRYSTPAHVFSTSIELLLWAKTSGRCPLELLYRAVAKGGQLKVMIAYDKHVQGQMQQLECQTWQLQQDAKASVWDTDAACEAAACGGQLHVLQWLKPRARQSWQSARMSAAAASGGHLHVLQWLRAEGHPFDVNCFTQAAMGGHMKVLQWLDYNGCPRDRATANLCMENALAHGNTDVVRWLTQTAAANLQGF